jgi:hypothetical protein
LAAPSPQAPHVRQRHCVIRTASPVASITDSIKEKVRFLLPHACAAIGISNVTEQVAKLNRLAAEGVPHTEVSDILVLIDGKVQMVPTAAVGIFPAWIYGINPNLVPKQRKETIRTPLTPTTVVGKADARLHRGDALAARIPTFGPPVGQRPDRGQISRPHDPQRPSSGWSTENVMLARPFAC